MTAGLSLVSPTTAPPAGAAPFMLTHTTVQLPPARTPGDISRDFTEAGCTVNVCDVTTPFSVAVSVTGVVCVTVCETFIWNCSHAVLAGIDTVAGTGAIDWLELVMLIVAPDAPTADVSCTCTMADSPGNSGSLVTVIDTGLGGVFGMVKDLTSDHAVAAAVVGEASPWNDRTRQNFVPGVNERIVRDGPFSCGESSSMLPKFASFATCSSYPLGCGFGT